MDEALIRSMADNQMASLESLILAQRSAQLKMAQYLRDAEARHAKVARLGSRQEIPSKHFVILHIATVTCAVCWSITIPVADAAMSIVP